jgi:hypothetical protein
MARITDVDIEVARSLIARKDLEGLCDWYDQHNPCIDKVQFRKTFYLMFECDDADRALKFFDSLHLEGTNPTTQCIIDAIVNSVGCLLSVVFILGCLGGIGFLLTYLF